MSIRPLFPCSGCGVYDGVDAKTNVESTFDNMKCKGLWCTQVWSTYEGWNGAIMLTRKGYAKLSAHVYSNMPNDAKSTKY